MGEAEPGEVQRNPRAGGFEVGHGEFAPSLLEIPALARPVVLSAPLPPAAPRGGLLGWRFGDDPLPLGRHHQQEGFPPSLHQHQVPGHAAHQEMRGRGVPVLPRPAGGKGGRGGGGRWGGRKRGALPCTDCTEEHTANLSTQDTLTRGPRGSGAHGHKDRGGDPLCQQLPPTPALGGPSGTRSPSSSWPQLSECTNQ